MTHLERKDWIRALAAHPPASLIAFADELTNGCDVRFTRLPQAGLGLMTLTDGAFHEPYYLGEFPLSTCSIEIVLADGRKSAGGAQIMADDAELAQALAVLDGILAGRLPGWERIAEQVALGAARCAETDRRRRAMLATTRVDFAMLNDGEETEGSDAN